MNLAKTYLVEASKRIKNPTALTEAFKEYSDAYTDQKQSMPKAKESYAAGYLRAVDDIFPDGALNITSRLKDSLPDFQASTELQDLADALEIRPVPRFEALGWRYDNLEAAVFHTIEVRLQKLYTGEVSGGNADERFAKHLMVHSEKVKHLLGLLDRWYAVTQKQPPGESE